MLLARRVEGPAEVVTKKTGAVVGSRTLDCPGKSTAMTIGSGTMKGMRVNNRRLSRCDVIMMAPFLYAGHQETVQVGTSFRVSNEPLPGPPVDRRAVSTRPVEPEEDELLSLGMKRGRRPVQHRAMTSSRRVSVIHARGKDVNHYSFVVGPTYRTPGVSVQPVPSL